MTAETEKLLAVLDMTEEEQLLFLDKLWGKRQIPEDCMISPNIKGEITMTLRNKRVLADLAERMIGETKRITLISKTDEDYNLQRYALREGMMDVYDYLHDDKVYRRNPDQKFFIFWIEEAKSIQKIIASCIAKLLAGSK